MHRIRRVIHIDNCCRRIHSAIYSHAICSRWCKSPPKQKAGAKSVANRFHLRITLQERNRWWKKQELSENEESWLNELSGRPDNKYLIPGKNDQVYMGKVDGRKVSDTANGCKWYFCQRLCPEAIFPLVLWFQLAHQTECAQQRYSPCHIPLWNL